MIQTALYPTGRKHCCDCGRWRPLIDFSLYRQRGVVYLKSMCQTCLRQRGRVANGLRVRGEPYGPRRRATHCHWGHSLADAVVRADGSRECCSCKRERQLTPESREYQRIWAEAKRRKAGVPPRHWRTRKTPQDHTERLRLPAGPFAEWLRENAPPAWEDRARWCREHGTDESTVRRIIEGKYRQVHIDVVDRAVGPDVLNELYPVEELVPA